MKRAMLAWGLAAASVAGLAGGLVAGSATGSASGASVQQSSASGPRPVTWRSLEYEASKFFMTATSTVRLSLPGAPAARRALEPCPHADCTPIAPTGQTAALTLDTSFVGRRSTETVWFDAIDGRTLQRQKRKHGSSGYTKLHRFGERGIGYRRAAPASGEEDRDPAQWTDTATLWIGEPAGARGCPVVSPVALFYLLSSYPWSGEASSDGQGFEICIFTNRAYSRLSVRRVGTEVVDVAVDGLPTRGKVQAIAVDLVAKTFDGSDPKEKFELLGLEGDIRMLLDPTTGIPITFRGDLSSLGEVEVELERVGFE